MRPVDGLHALHLLGGIEGGEKPSTALVDVCKYLVHAPEWEESGWRENLSLWWPTGWTEDKFSPSFPHAFLFVLGHTDRPEEVFYSLYRSSEGVTGLARVLLHSLRASEVLGATLSVFWSLCTSAESQVYHCSMLASQECFFMSLSRACMSLMEEGLALGRFSLADAEYLESVLYQWKEKCSEDIIQANKSLFLSQLVWEDWIRDRLDLSSTPSSNSINQISIRHPHLYIGWELKVLQRLIETVPGWRMWILGLPTSLKLYYLEQANHQDTTFKEVLSSVVSLSEALELENHIQNHQRMFQEVLISFQRASPLGNGCSSIISIISTSFPSSKALRKADGVEEYLLLSKILSVPSGRTLFPSAQRSLKDTNALLSDMEPITAGLTESSLLLLGPEDFAASWLYLSSLGLTDSKIGKFMHQGYIPSHSEPLVSQMSRVISSLVDLIESGEGSLFHHAALRAFSSTQKGMLSRFGAEGALPLSLKGGAICLQSLEHSPHSVHFLVASFDALCYTTLWCLREGRGDPGDVGPILLVCADLPDSFLEHLHSESNPYLQRVTEDLLVIGLLFLQTLPGADERVIQMTSGPIQFPILCGGLDEASQMTRHHFNTWRYLLGVIRGSGFREEVLLLIANIVSEFGAFQDVLFLSHVSHSDLTSLLEGSKGQHEMGPAFCGMRDFVVCILQILANSSHSETAKANVDQKRCIRIIGELLYLTFPLPVLLQLDMVPTLLSYLPPHRGREDGARQNASICIATLFTSILQDAPGSLRTNEDEERFRLAMKRRLLRSCASHRAAAILIHQGVNQQCSCSIQLTSHCLEALQSLCGPLTDEIALGFQHSLLLQIADKSTGLLPVLLVRSFSFASLFTPEAEPGGFLLIIVWALVEKDLVSPSNLLNVLDRLLSMDPVALYAALPSLTGLLKRIIDSPTLRTALKIKNVHQKMFVVAQGLPRTLLSQREVLLQLGRRIAS